METFSRLRPAAARLAIEAGRHRRDGQPGGPQGPGRHRSDSCHGAEVLFLPPYSPEYNPIEKAWAKLKDILCGLPTLSRDAFDDAVAFAMTEISGADVRAWTAFAGYSLGSI
jgi:transposase